MSPTSDQQPQPPAPEAWEGAPVLLAVDGPAAPELISDGGGLPFAPASLTLAAPPLDPGDPAVAALLVQIDRGRQQAQPARVLRPRLRPAPLDDAAKLEGWRELARDGQQALFGRGMPPRLLTVAVRSGRRGRWEPLGASNSRPLRAVRDGVRASSWRLDPVAAADPESDVLRILITERTMASGTPVADRLLAPELHLTAERALLRMYVRPLTGYVGRTGRHETPVIVRLPEPLALRRAVDGALYEPLTH
ncbi:MAG: hypothetical protein M0T77_01810 [Actinomycetota bacterium]|nr:hypothetical protein [Actinomycetota bacterium]